MPNTFSKNKKTILGVAAAGLLAVGIGYWLKAQSSDKDELSVAELRAMAAEAYKKDDIEEAVEIYNELVRRLPEDPGVFYGRAFSLVKAKRFEEAEEDARRGLHLSPSARGCYALGRALQQQGRLSEAKKPLLDSIKTSPHSKYAEWSQKLLTWIEKKENSASEKKEMDTSRHFTPQKQKPAPIPVMEKVPPHPASLDGEMNFISADEHTHPAAIKILAPSMLQRTGAFAAQQFVGGNVAQEQIGNRSGHIRKGTPFAFSNTQQKQNREGKLRQLQPPKMDMSLAEEAEEEETPAKPAAFVPSTLGALPPVSLMEEEEEEEEPAHDGNGLGAGQSGFLVPNGLGGIGEIAEGEEEA